MKLHLPLSLRLSLALSVAAMAAAPSHAAVTSYDITTWSGYQDGVVTVGRTVAEDGTASVNSTYMTLSPKPAWNTEWSIVFSAKGDSLKGSLTLLGLELDSSAGASGTVGIVEGATMSEGNLTLTTWTHEAGVSGAVDFSGYDNVTFVMSRHSDGTFTFIGYNSNDFTHEIFNWTDDHAQSFNKFYFRGVVFGALGTHSAYDNDGNHVSFASDDDIGSYDLTKAGYSLGSVATVNDLVNYYYDDAQHKDLTWAGGENGTWSGAFWSDGGAAGNVNFAALDSVTFATEGATVTLDAVASADTLSVNADTHIVLDNNLSANSLTVADQKTLTLTGSGSVETTSLSGGAVDVSGSTVIVDGTVSGTTLTVRDGGTVTAQSITGVTATVEKATESTQGSTLALAGTTLGAADTETVVNGALTLTGDARVTVAGTVTLGSVVNNLTGKSDQTYAFIGGSDAILTFSEGQTDLTSGGSNVHSAIGINGGMIIVKEGASLKTSRVYNSSNAASNAEVEVEKGGKLEITGSSSNTMKSLVNVGTVTTTADLTIAEGSNSSLGGTMNVGGTLTLSSGTAEISGNVSANTVVGSSSVLQGSADGNGTLTVKGAGVTGYKSGPALKGNLTVVKEGSYTQNFGGNNSAFTGSLTVKSGIMNLSQFGEDTQINLKDISVSANATLALYAKTFSSADESFRANISVASLAADGGTLKANVVLGNASSLILDGTLTLNGSLTLNQTLLSGSLLGSLSEKGDKVTLFDGLAWSSLTIGSGVSVLSMTEAGEWTTDADGNSYYQFTSADLEAAFRDLDSSAYEMRYYGTETGASGSLAMVLIPEPTATTLSLLALAGLCARRRRR